MAITWEMLIRESLPNKLPESPVSRLAPVKQDLKSSAHCKMRSIMLAMDCISSDKKHMCRESVRYPMWTELRSIISLTLCLRQSRNLHQDTWDNCDWTYCCNVDTKWLTWCLTVINLLKCRISGSYASEWRFWLLICSKSFNEDHMSVNEKIASLTRIRKLNIWAYISKARGVKIILTGQSTL